MDSIAGPSVIVKHILSRNLVLALCVGGNVVLGWHLLYVDCTLSMAKRLSIVWFCC